MSTKNSNDIDEERTMFIKLPSSGTDAAEIVVEDDNSSDDSILLQDDIAKKQTALDSVITKIGMGKFQKQLLVLCGLGWLADNMWLQCIAVILPRVQKHFGLPNSLIGALSSSLFTGMMFGALFWGVLSDTHGRKQAFNWTLAVTTFFGIIASFAQSFFQLCFMLFLLGFGVGGNMPVDGALFLEFIPKEHQYLLTFMSVFFSFGAVLSSVLAYFILPPNSCTEDDCNVFEENNGWRYMLAILGSLTFLMLMCRIFFFQLQESPKYLISRNRKHDAVLVLRKIAKINGNNMQIQASDFPTPANTTNPRNRSFSSFPFPNETQHAKVEFISDPISYIKYKTSSNIEVVMSLFTRKWFMTTILVWCIWTLVSFAYTMFNVFLPKYLESLGLDNGGSGGSGGSDSLMQDVLKDYVVYSLCGVPGSLAAAWLIETVLGRIGTMSIATFGTALSVFLFSVVKSHSSEIISSAMVSFLATLNYAVIYGYTPEVFESKVRGTACGIASAFGRVAGIIAPMVTGLLLSISANNWDEDSVDPCSWAMITCSPDNLVIGLGAPSQGLSGDLSATIANLTNLRQVLLQNNNISGEIPPEISSLPSLQTLDLSNNRFYGHVPESLGRLTNLLYLRLNNNSLSGSIPLSLAKLPQLAFLDLSYNNLSGAVPKFPARTFNFVGNPLICGSHSNDGCSGSPFPIPLSFSLTSSPGKGSSKTLAIALGVGLGFVILILLAVGFLFWRKNRRKKQIILNINDMQEEGLMNLGNLRNFTFRELQVATDNFSSKNILGAGGFGNVYKGKFGDGTMVAVKRLKDVIGTAGESQFKTELEMISLAIHRNLLRLIGYCATPNERLLVYPYMSNGSVASRLREKPALDWNTRKRIAIGAARGLLYLHEQCDPKIIHRDVKAANILLDDYCEAIVGDFGLAKLLDHADSHVTTAVRGTVGHIAPEYLSTGQSSEKTDVFGFGILLIELITGMRALEFGKTVNQKGAMLEWVRKVQQEKKVELLVDRELGSNYDRIEVGEMLQVALLCTQYLPAHRPRMSEVVHMLEGDGVAEKWAASHNHVNPCTNFFPGSKDNKFHSYPAMFPMHDDNDNDHSSMFGLMSDDDHGAHAMELSGPR